MSIKTVLVIGLAVVDFLFEVEQLPQSAEKFVSTEADVVGGGGAANAAVAVTRLGGDAMLSARVGNDLFGDLIVDQLKQEGVDCSLVQKTQGARSSFSSVLVDQCGERQIVNFRGSGLSNDATMLESLQVDAVLTDTRWTTATQVGLLLARELGVPGVIDGEAPVNLQALKLASHCAFSRQGLTALTGIDDPHQALLAAKPYCAGFVCVTDGANGVYYLQDDTVQHVPAYSINAIDTLGAGDVWHGAFCLALAERKNELQSIRFANAAAGLKCLRKGGRSSPGRSQVSDFLKQQTEVI